MSGLTSDTNTRTVERRVLRAAHAALGRGLQAVYEHGQWWVVRPRTGAQWSVCDASGPGSVDGFCFESVSAGDAS